MQGKKVVCAVRTIFRCMNPTFHVMKLTNKSLELTFHSMTNRKEKDAEDAVVNRASELKQLSIDIDRATTAVINAKLSLESSIRQTQREEGVLGAAVNTISDKVDTINEHIDQVMEDAPTKLKVTVNVSEADWQNVCHG